MTTSSTPSDPIAAFLDAYVPPSMREAARTELAALRSRVGTCHCNKREPEFGPPCDSAAECERGLREEAERMHLMANDEVARLRKALDAADGLYKAARTIDAHVGGTDEDNRSPGDRPVPKALLDDLSDVLLGYEQATRARSNETRKD